MSKTNKQIRAQQALEMYCRLQDTFSGGSTQTEFELFNVRDFIVELVAV